jgi:hypothetical protein
VKRVGYFALALQSRLLLLNTLVNDALHSTKIREEINRVQYVNARDCMTKKNAEFVNRSIAH